MRTNALYRVMIQGLLSVNRELALASAKATLTPAPCAPGQTPLASETDASDRSQDRWEAPGVD